MLRALILPAPLPTLMIPLGPQWAVLPHDPIFFFHHNGLDKLRRHWQARNAHLKPMAYGYPIDSPGYTAAYGTPVGLRDCLGCTAYNAGFLKGLLLGNMSDTELALLSISDGWLTNEDLLCVIDDLYTFDVIESETTTPSSSPLQSDPPCRFRQMRLGSSAMYAGLALAATLLAMTLAKRCGCLGAVVGMQRTRLEASAAPWLILGSAFSASLMSLSAGSLAARGMPTVTIAAACGAVANLLFVLMHSATADTATQQPALHLLAAQAILGGLLPHLAFFAISRSGLAVANCLMFTM